MHIVNVEIYLYTSAHLTTLRSWDTTKKAYLNTHYTVDGQDAQDELEKILPPRPPTNTHGVVLWTTKSLEHGSKDDKDHRSNKRW